MNYEQDKDYNPVKFIEIRKRVEEKKETHEDAIWLLEEIKRRNELAVWAWAFNEKKQKEFEHEI